MSRLDACTKQARTTKTKPSAEDIVLTLDNTLETQDAATLQPRLHLRPADKAVQPHEPARFAFKLDGLSYTEGSLHAYYSYGLFAGFCFEGDYNAQDALITMQMLAAEQTLLHRWTLL